jgi:DNA primase
MALPDSFLEEVRRTADIVRFIGEHIALRKVGNSWKGLCPFHQEKTPSFHVRADPPVFHCFGCGEGGDIFKFVMLHERVAFPEALETVARRFGVPIPERSSADGHDRKEREALLAVMEAAAAHFTRSLWSESGRAAREYLLGRSFERATLERIRAGAARDSWSGLLDDLSRQHPTSALLAAGLILERQDKKGHYDRFRNRAVFPILNESGKVVAFGARALDGSEPKYLNSPETPVYHKASTLYGLSWAKDAIRKGGRAVLVEGYLDVARALEQGVGEVVASCGTALTPAHARLLRRFTDQVIVNYDQDPAGQKAASRSLDLLLEQGFKLAIVELPEGHDPDSFLRAFGADAYRRRLEEAPPYMDWIIRRAARENDLRAPAGKAAFLNAVLPTLARIENAVERAAWIPSLVAEGQLDESATVEELRRAVAARATTASLPTRVPPGARSLGLMPAEKFLLACLMRGEEDRAGLAALADEEIRGLASAALLRAARSLVSRGIAVSASSLTAEVQDEDGRRLLSEIAVEDSPAGEQSASECLRELRRLSLERRLEEIERLRKGLAPGDETAVQLAQEKLDVTRRMRSL